MPKVASRWIRTPSDEAAVAEGCHFSLKAAERVRHFFRSFLRHSKGDFAGKPFELLPWQWDEVIAPLFGWLRPDGSRRFRVAYIELPKKQGKLLDVETPIPTPGGWSMMGDLAVGDWVFDDMGSPCQVVATSEICHEQPYRLLFSDGTDVVAGARHEWRTKCVSRGKKMASFTTEEIYRTQYQGKNKRRNHLVAVNGSLECDAVDLPIDPYTFGAWIGNGKASAGDITIRRGDAATVASIGKQFGISSSWPNPGESDHYYLPGMVTELRALGVLNNKHIPEIYLRASQAQRLELLQGLIDTDGNIGPKGQCGYFTTVDAIRDGVLDLLRGLGFKTTHRWIDESWRTDRSSLGHWKISFTAYRGDKISRLERKCKNLPVRPATLQRSAWKTIVSVEPVLWRALKCIQVDSPSRMYLCGPGMIPTHNSTMASGIGLYLLCGDGEQGAEVYSLAADRDQANIVHKEAVQMVRASEGLNSFIKINASTYNMSFPKANGWYRALSSEANTKEGLNANGLIIDELHAWSGRKLYDTVKYAGLSRRQPLMFQITTAGDDMQSICRQQHDYAMSVIRGSVQDTRFFPYIRAARAIAEGDKDNDDWTDPKVWKAANPSLGVTIREDDFAADCEEAKITPSSVSAFKRYRLNIWATSSNPWLRIEDWNACGESFGEQDLLDKDCFGGLDLSSTQDLSAFVLCFPMPDETYRFLPYFWIHEHAIESRDWPEQYRVWHRAGHLRATPGSVVNYGFVKRDIVALSEKFRLREFAFDPYNAEQTTQELEEESGLKRFLFRQGMLSFNEPTKEFERLILSKRLRHPNHPILTWMAGHVHVEHDKNGNKRPIKPGSDKDPRKVDGIVAAVMALARAMLGRDAISIYESRGIESLEPAAEAATPVGSPLWPLDEDEDSYRW